MSELRRLARDLTEPEPIPEAGIMRANALMRSGRLFRYGEMGADQADVSLLEQEFAAFVGRNFCIGVNSGGSALFLALKIADVQAGDPVLVNGFTLAPVPGAILHAGARPVIVEIDQNYVIDLADLQRKARSSGAKVLMLSHMRGHIADMGEITRICAGEGIALIEDCAHALAAKWDGRMIGTFGLASGFSAQTYKHLNAGEGGFLVLDDPERAARAIVHSGSYMLHSQHLSSPGAEALRAVSNTTPNFSLRMTALAAAMLRPQLAELPRRVARWNAIHDRIAASLARSQWIALPKRGARAEPAATSIQFSIPALSSSQIEAFLKIAKARGLPVKWFGAREQIGFTSAPHHWHYAGAQEDLAKTHAILASLMDIRTPISLSDEECDLIAEIVRDSIDGVLETGSNQPGESPDLQRAS
jgi:dTDP-4-amino-4,6-dideoxygalactose transaminase